jgi:hypothetical protein
MGKAALSVVLLLAGSAAWGQTPPVDQKTFFPESDASMARALADPMIALETKAALFMLFERRLWPQTVEDRDGNVWLYRRGENPVMIKSGPMGH